MGKSLVEFGAVWRVGNFARPTKNNMDGLGIKIKTKSVKVEQKSDLPFIPFRPEF